MDDNSNNEDNISTLFVENKDVERAVRVLSKAGIAHYQIDGVPFGAVSAPFMTLDEVEAYVEMK